MTVRLDAGVIRLEGPCRVEDAESLASHLSGGTSGDVDVSNCEQLHSSVIQALIAFRPSIVGTCDDPFIQTHVLGPMTALHD